MTQRENSFKGAMTGTVVGDCLGYRSQGVEFRLVARRYPDAAKLAAIKPGPAGAATLMTIAVAESLAAEPEFYPADLAARLAAAYQEDCGFGRGTARVLQRLREGEHWKRAAQGPGGRGSFGNGAAVRSAPIGLVMREDADSLRWTAEEAAAITHDHAFGTEGAVMHAYAVAIASLAYRRQVDGQGFLRSLAEATSVREYRARYRTAAELLERKNLTAKAIVDRLGNASTALGSVPTAAFCFAEQPGNFERAMSRALSLGGSACAIASMTGALAGACLGHEAIPVPWRDHLEVQQAVIRLSPLWTKDLRKPSPREEGA